MPDEVWQLGILERVLLEVGSQANREDFSAKEMKGLVQPCCAFAVRYTIEDVLGGLSMDNVNRNGMSRIHLIFLQTPERLVQEYSPSQFALFKTWSLILTDIRNIVCESLVEPEVVPPFHGDEVSEPHVGDFVQEGVVNTFLFGV